MTTQSSDKIQEFRADALRVSESRTPITSFRGVDKTMTDNAETNSDVKSGFSLGNLFNVSGSATQQNEREIGLQSETLSGMGDSGASSSARIIAQQQRDSERRKASNDTIMFLQMLEELSAQIKALEDQIEHYDEQIEATDSLIDILESGGEIDPTDPEHQRLLRLAGIPEDEWGVVTLEDLKSHRIDLQTKRDDAKVELDKKVAEEASLLAAESRLDQGLSVDAGSLSTPEAVAQYAASNTDVDLDNLSKRDLIEIGKINLVSEYVARAEHVERDADWFKAAYAELNLSTLDGEVLENSVSLLVEALSDNAREAILKDDGLDQALVDYLVEDKIVELQSSFDLSDSDQLMFVEMALTDLSEQALRSIHDSHSSSDELKAITNAQLEQTDSGFSKEISNPEF